MTEAEYEDALREITRRWNDVDTTALMALVDAVERYEEEHFPIDPPSPEDAARFRAEQEQKNPAGTGFFLSADRNKSDETHQSIAR